MRKRSGRPSRRSGAGRTVEEFAVEWGLPVQDALHILQFDVDPGYQGDDVVILEEE
jgi:hypothetical protein